MYVDLEKTHPIPAIRKQVGPAVRPTQICECSREPASGPVCVAWARLEDCLGGWWRAMLASASGSPDPCCRCAVQAADLRYIMEAPKLELSPDEKVQIPVLDDLEPNRWGRSNSAGHLRCKERVPLLGRAAAGGSLRGMDTLGWRVCVFGEGGEQLAGWASRQPHEGKELVIVRQAARLKQAACGPLPGRRSNRSAPAARPRPVGRGGGERRVAKSWDEEFWENYRCD